jgi:predicted metal-binding membrane protein
MNMVWMAILTIFMLVEKAYPGSQWVSRTTGLILVGWGLWIVAGTMG